MIDTADGAERLARRLLSKVERLGENQSSSLADARTFFAAQVAPQFHSVFDRVLAAPKEIHPRVNAPAWGSTEVVVPAPFAQVTALGRVVRVWTTKDRATWVPLMITFAGFVGLVIAAMVAIFGPLPAAIAPCIIGSLLLPLGLYNVVRLRRSARALVIYDTGFAALVGAHVSVWAWSEVTSILSKEKMITGGRMAYPERNYEICKNDAVLVLNDDNFEDVKALSSEIKQRANDGLLPSFRAQYDGGQSITFGPVTISLDGIAVRSQNLAWGAVQGVVVKDGRLIITPKEGSPLRVPASKIPNIEILGALIGVDPSNMDLMYI